MKKAKKIKKPVFMPKKDLMILSNAYNKHGLDGLLTELSIHQLRLEQYPDQHKTNTWLYNVTKMQSFVFDLMTGNKIDKMPYSVFNKSGNKKLPFYAFSTLPLFSCPGMGICAKFCYSLKAWRYPSAYFRQLMNFILLDICPELIEQAFHKIKLNSDLRLYVDGDFKNASDLIFWMQLLEQRLDINSYGYSKSWELFLNYKKPFAPNYTLNLSSGSIYGHLKNDMLKLSCVRGEFIAVKSNVKQKKNNKNWLEYSREVRRSAKDQGINKVFVCPGQCGSCTKMGHACGLDSFKDIIIAIGIH